MWLGRAMALRNAEHGGSEPRQGDRAAEGEPASRAAFPSTSLRGGSGSSRGSVWAPHRCLLPAARGDRACAAEAEASGRNVRRER